MLRKYFIRDRRRRKMKKKKKFVIIVTSINEVFQWSNIETFEDRNSYLLCLRFRRIILELFICVYVYVLCARVCVRCWGAHLYPERDDRWQWSRNRRKGGCGICLPFVPQLFSDHRRISVPRTIKWPGLPVSQTSSSNFGLVNDFMFSCYDIYCGRGEKLELARNNYFFDFT